MFGMPNLINTPKNYGKSFGQHYKQIKELKKNAWKIGVCIIINGS